MPIEATETDKRRFQNWWDSLDPAKKNGWSPYEAAWVAFRDCATRINKIAAIYDTVRFEDVEGHRIAMSTDAYLNLEGAIIDLERTGCDAVCLNTLKRVAIQLAEIGKELAAARKVLE